MNQQRIAVVTGGNRGIGFEICRQLAQQGIQVVLTARNVAQGQAAADQLRQTVGPVQFQPLDITQPHQIQNLVSWVENQFGHLDILVNNAGVYLDQHQAALTISPDLITQAVNTDVCGTFALCQAVIPLMRAHGYGRIVNLSSRTSQLDQMNNLGLTYKISKAAINVITVVLAQDVKEDNILINAVNPGWIKTDMGGEAAQRSPTAQAPEHGAAGPVWLATLPDGGPSGCFFNGCALVPW